MDAHRARPLRRVCLMALALVLLFLLSFVWGRYDVPLGQVVRPHVSCLMFLQFNYTNEPPPLQARPLQFSPSPCNPP